MAAAAVPTVSVFGLRYRSMGLGQQLWGSHAASGLMSWKGHSLLSTSKRGRRRTLVYAFDQDAEKSFKNTFEEDCLIDTLRVCNPGELERLVVENVLAFSESFWIRLAARTDNCKSDDDKKDYEELASSVMSIVDRLVHKTNEKIESATDTLKAILRPVMDEVQEVFWPPRDPRALNIMEEEVQKREREGQLDEGFLTEVNAQLRQGSCFSPLTQSLSEKTSSTKFVPDMAKKDGDKPGLTAMLQKVLQLYASNVLSKRSYAFKGGKVIVAEKFLESVIEAPEESWNKLLIDGLTIGKGEVSPEELYAVIKKRIERVLIRTEGGSYEQRILVEYLKGIQSRTEEIVQIFQSQQE